MFKIIELLPDAALLIDGEGVVRLANLPAQALFASSALAGRTVESLMPERYRAHHRAVRKSFTDQGQTRRMETGNAPFLIMGADGHETPVEISIGSAYLGANGEAIRLVTLIDCSERLAMENALKEREAFYRGLFDKAPQPYQSLDVDGRLVDVNEAWLKQFGVASKNQVLGRFFGDFMSVSSRELMGTALEKCKSDGDVGNPVFEARRVDNGQDFLITVHGRVERDGDGNFIRTQCLLTDVSERARVEREILRLNAELEQRVLARTNELLVARAEAESANAVKTRFMMNVSHEMRTPLNGVLSTAKVGLMRLERGDSSKIREVLDNIRASGERLRILIESLLRLTEDAWKEHSQIPNAALRPVDLKHVVDEVFAIKASAAERRRQILALELQTGSPVVHGEPALLAQVLGHLVDNALRYSPEQTRVVVRLSDESNAARSAQAGACCLVEVIDDGCGVPEGELETIFEPFYQSTRTWNGSGGTGLGLPLCRSIVSKLNGSIVAKNRAGGGAVFELRLPRSAVQ